jgi:hypothetical protein
MTMRLNGCRTMRLMRVRAMQAAANPHVSGERVMHRPHTALVRTEHNESILRFQFGPALLGDKPSTQR